MTERYRRMSQRHAAWASFAAISGIICMTGMFYGCAVENGECLFLSALGAIAAAAISLTQFHESRRCSKVARNWDAYDRRDLPPIQ